MMPISKAEPREDSSPITTPLRASGDEPLGAIVGDEDDRCVFMQEG